MIRAAPLLSLALLLAGCDGNERAEPPPARDPQVARALNDPLMTDPDLSSRNEAAAALTVEVDSGLPVLPATPEEVVRAKAEAAQIAGGADKLVAPGEPVATGEPLARDAAPRERLAALLGGSRACGNELAPSARWAARMPAALPIYPRAHTLDAAGSDAPKCRVRTVAFATPVPPGDVLAFYAARIRALGGAGPPLLQAGDDLRLRGAGGSLVYDIYARDERDRTLVRLTTLER